MATLVFKILKQEIKNKSVDIVNLKIIDLHHQLASLRNIIPASKFGMVIEN